jgi:hypothetical protein
LYMLNSLKREIRYKYNYTNDIWLYKRRPYSK